MDEKGLSTEDLVMVLNDGDVDFGQSEKDKKSKVYILEKEGVKFAFTLPYESFISEAFVGVKNAEITPTKSGYGDILHFPPAAVTVICNPQQAAKIFCSFSKHFLTN